MKPLARLHLIRVYSRPFAVEFAMAYRRKLIEVALPLEDINREAAREKSIRHGHPLPLQRQPIKEFGRYLNEAALSAFAIALFLAGGLQRSDLSRAMG